MRFGDAGLVSFPVEGKPITLTPAYVIVPIRRGPMRHGFVPEYEPAHVTDWGRLGVDYNGRVVNLDGAADDAVAALDKAGAHGAAALGALVGLLISNHKVIGTAAGGLVGYFGGAYITNVIKKVIGAVQTASSATSAVKG